MKNIYKFLFVVAAFLSAATITAQTYVGYSTGDGNRKQGVRFGSDKKQGVAIRISKEKAQQLNGSKITGLRSMFGTAQVSNFEVFATKSLTADPFFKQSLGNASTSWNDYMFSEALPIDGEEFYIGYTLEMALDTYKPNIFDQKEDFGNGLFWAYTDGTWKDISLSGYGAPAIRLIVEGAPKFADLVMKPVYAGGFYKQGNAYTYNGQVFNFGTETVNSFEISCQIGADEPTIIKVEEAELAPNGVYDFTIEDYKPANVGKLEMKVNVTNVNGADDAETSDNLSSSKTYIYPADVKKKVLMELFTGQACGNCPAGHMTIENMIGSIAHEFVEVAHHSGYQPDAFSMIEDWSYTFFYNDNSYYAPGAMFNRAAYKDGIISPIFNPTNLQDLGVAVAFARNHQPYVGVEVSSEFDDATRHGKATVKVHTYNKPEIPADAVVRLNLHLTQNNIVGYQAGGGSEYVHNHAFRGSLTDIWGIDIELVEGETVTKTFEYDIPEAIVSSYYTEDAPSITAVPEDMHLVAFVACTSNNVLDWNVYNVESTPLKGAATDGIDDMKADAAAPSLAVSGNTVAVLGHAAVEVFTPAGALVKKVPAGAGSFHLASGLYVARLRTASGAVSSCKLLVK